MSCLTEIDAVFWNASEKYCVGVAVCAASYSFDRLFSYLSLQPIAPGCRVIVPFGKGNAKRVGIVLTCQEQEQTESQLKNVLSVVDQAPLLSREMLDLVFWLEGNDVLYVF